MLFEFIGTAYSCSILILICLYYFTNNVTKKYIKNFIAVSNTLLIFYSFYLTFKFYQLVKYIHDLNIKPTPKLKQQPIEITWFHVKFLLLICIPFLFLIKKIKTNHLLSIVMLILLQWDIAEDVYYNLILNTKTSGINFYMPYLAFFKILNYVSLFILVYALLWLTKKLPSQTIK